MDQKSFQELVFKEFKNRKRSGYVDRQQVRSIDQNLFFFKPNSFPESSFPLTSGRKTKSSGSNHFEITEFCPSGFTAQSASMRTGHARLKCLLPELFVFRPLVKGNEDSGYEIVFKLKLLSFR